jgi:hypothetical protein
MAPALEPNGSQALPVHNQIPNIPCHPLLHRETSVFASNFVNT